MTNDLIERYIYAATKRLTGKIRADVSDELRTIIDDMLTERCGNITPSKKDIKVVLTELGTPQELYEQYNPDSDKCLIGSPYYSTYKYVLKIVLICVCAGITLATLMSPLADAFGSTAPSYTNSFIIYFRDFFVDLFIALPSALVWAFAFVTILFAIFYHKNIKIDNTGNLDNLPPVPVKKEKISKAEPIVGIAISIAFMSVFLICPQIFSFGITKTNTWIPIFNIDTIHSTWYIIVLFGVLGIIRESVKLIESRRNKKVMITSIVTNALSAVMAVIWLARDNILNSDFIDCITGYFTEAGDVIPSVLSNFQLFFMGVILFALAIDTIDVIVKTLKVSK